jgi:predicted phosphodiesterase
MKAQTWVFAPDLHYPQYDRPTWLAMLDFIKKNKIAGIILGGDQFHNDEISHHNAGKPLFKPAGSYKRNEENFKREILLPLERAASRSAIKIWFVGNHDRWETDLSEANPELDGCFDRTKNIDEVRRHWKVIENGKAYKLGKLCIIHGDSLANGFNISKFPTERAVLVYGQSVLFGHTHQAQSFSKVSPVEASQKYMAWSSPALCKVNPTYMKNKPCAWVNGFTIVEVFDNGDFCVYPVVVTRGRFSYGCKKYGK